MVEIIGKRNRKAPVLLTPDVKNTIEPLISMREQRKVSRNSRCHQRRKVKKLQYGGA